MIDTGNKKSKTQSLFLKCLLPSGSVAQLLSCVLFCAIPWTVAHQSMGFPRQEYWSELPFPSVDLSDPWMETMSPALAGVFFTSEPPGKPKMNSYRESKEGEKSLESIVALFYGHICCSSELLPSVLKYMYSHLYLEIFMIMLKQQNWNFLGKFSLAQFSSSVMSNSLRPHGLQHTRLPCPSPAPRVYSNSCPLSRWCHPIISSSVVPLLLPPSVISSIRVFSNVSVFLSRWPEYWSFSFSIGPSNEYSGLIFFRMDWLDFLAVQGTLKSLLQHYSSKASILQCSAFFVVLFSLLEKPKLWLDGPLLTK